MKIVASEKLEFWIHFVPVWTQSDIYKTKDHVFMLVIYLVLHFIILWPSAFNGNVTIEVGLALNRQMFVFSLASVYIGWCNDGIQILKFLIYSF